MPVFIHTAKDTKDVSDSAFDVTYTGAVLQTYERNGYDDSDFVAIVYDADRDIVAEIVYGSTRSWTYNNGATVDATPEVIERAREILFEEMVQARAAASQAAARVLDVGREVRVKGTKTGKGRTIKGQFFPAGTPGQVVWAGPDQYRYGKTRYGVEIDGVRVYGSDELFEVADPERFELSADEVRAGLIGPECIRSFHRPRPGVINAV